MDKKQPNESGVVQQAVEALPEELRPALFRLLLRLGDDRLILGHRLSEWCGHAPILEEDIALANIALDNVGQAEALLRLAGLVEGKGRSEDDIAFLRDAPDFFCTRMVELPRGDFGFTIVRQFLFSTFSLKLWERLSQSTFTPLAGIAQKSLKESVYHVRHCREWLLRLGDGTEESHQRAQSALEELWPYTSELFASPEGVSSLGELGIASPFHQVREGWEGMVFPTLEEATLSKPDGENQIYLPNSSTARHTEHLSHLLAEMQVLPRTFPGAQW